jgi:predicted nucleic acid-binding protein
VNFWDTSAIVPLLVREVDTPSREAQLRKANGIIVWWATRLECVSALCRRERESHLSPEAIHAALARLGALERQWQVVSPSQAILARAERLLKVHSLRAADSLQLAAALLATREEPDNCTFHTADARLALAAGKESFAVI